MGQTVKPISDSVKSLNALDSIDVKLMVQFVINKNEKVSNTQVLSIDCFDCSKEQKQNYQKEALRVVDEMPQWESKKITKRTKFLLPITLRVENPNK
jgi:hypothetical protein